MGEIDDFAKERGGTVYHTEDWINFKGIKPIILRIDNKIKGIFFNGGACPLAESRVYIKKLFDMAEEEKTIRFSVTQLDPFFKEVCFEAISRGYEFRPFFNLYKNLEQEEKTIWESFDRKTRNCLRKAESSNIVVKEADFSEENKKIYYDIHKNMSKRAGIKSKPISYFNKFWLIKNKRIFFAYYEDRVIGGIILLYFKDYGSIFMSASFTEFLNLRPNDILWWTAIKECKKMGLKYLDFGGGMLKSYIEFKNGFKPEIVVNIIFNKYNTKKAKPYKMLMTLSRAYKIKILGG